LLWLEQLRELTAGGVPKIAGCFGGMKIKIPDTGIGGKAKPWYNVG